MRSTRPKDQEQLGTSYTAAVIQNPVSKRDIETQHRWVALPCHKMSIHRAYCVHCFPYLRLSFLPSVSQICQPNKTKITRHGGCCWKAQKKKNEPEMRTDTGYLKCQAQPPFGYCRFSLLIHTQMLTARHEKINVWGKKKKELDKGIS